MCGRVTLRRPARVRLERLDTRALIDELPAVPVNSLSGQAEVTTKERVGFRLLRVLIVGPMAYSVIPICQSMKL